MTGKELIDSIATTLSDESHTRWSRSMLRTYASQAMREIVSLVPRANSVSEVVTLDAGPEQTIPADAMRYLGAVRNMVDANTPGTHVNDVLKDVQDRFNPSWPSAQPSSTIKEVMYEPVMPDRFWVFPPASTGTLLEIRLSKKPTEIADANETDEIDIGAEYEEALVLGFLYRAFRINTDAASFEISSNYRQRFLQALNLSDQVSTPPEDKFRGDQRRAQARPGGDG